MKRFHSHFLTLFILSGLWLLPQAASANVIVEGVQGILWQVVVQVLGTFLGLAGVLFDYGINEFVIGFGEQYKSNGIGFAVDATWVVIRDFVNMTFIFGLVYIGMRMILDSDTSSTRRWLVNLIIAALLVNFSLFFTKFIVDVSNQFATSIASQGFVNKEGNDIEVSAALMDKLGISNVFFVDLPDAANQTPGFGYIFGTALLLIIATFVFAAGGILLIIRFAVLNLFFVFSPILFLGLILPPLAGSINKYWKTLISKAFFAPLYLLFIYISFSILDAMGQSGAIQNGNNLGGFAAGSGREVLLSAQNTFPFFILASVLLIASLVVANRLGADGASKAVSMGKDLSQKAQRGTTRFVQRNTVGYGARAVNRASEATQRGYNRLDARLSTTKTGRFVRGAATVASLGALSDKNVQAALGAGQKVSIAGSETAADVRKREREQRSRRNEQNDQVEREETRANSARILNDQNSTEDQRKDANAAMAKALKDTKNEELIAFAATGVGRKTLASEAYAKHLSDAQIKALEDSGIYTNEETTKLKESRDKATFRDIEANLNDVNATADKLNDTFDELGKTIKNLSEERLQNLDIDRLTDTKFASHLSDSQLESLQKSGKFTTQQMQTIRESRTTGLSNRINGNITDSSGNIIAQANTDTFKDKQRQKILSGSTQDVGKLPVAVFNEGAMAQYITPAMIEQRMKNGISLEDLKKIKTNIERYVTDPSTAASATQMWQKWQNSTTYGAQFFNT